MPHDEYMYIIIYIYIWNHIVSYRCQLQLLVWQSPDRHSSTSQPGCQPFDASRRLSPGQPAYAGQLRGFLQFLTSRVWDFLMWVKHGITRITHRLNHHIDSWYKPFPNGWFIMLTPTLDLDLRWCFRQKEALVLIWAEVVPQLRSAVPGSAPVVPTIVWESQMGR